MLTTCTLCYALETYRMPDDLVVVLQLASRKIAKWRVDLKSAALESAYKVLLVLLDMKRSYSSSVKCSRCDINFCCASWKVMPVKSIWASASPASSPSPVVALGATDAFLSEGASEDMGAVARLGRSLAWRVSGSSSISASSDEPFSAGAPFASGIGVGKDA